MPFNRIRAISADLGKRQRITFGELVFGRAMKDGRRSPRISVSKKPEFWLIFPIAGTSLRYKIYYSGGDMQNATSVSYYLRTK